MSWDAWGTVIAAAVSAMLTVVGVLTGLAQTRHAQAQDWKRWQADEWMRMQCATADSVEENERHAAGLPRLAKLSPEWSKAFADVGEQDREWLQRQRALAEPDSVPVSMPSDQSQGSATGGVRWGAGAAVSAGTEVVEVWTIAGERIEATAIPVRCAGEREPDGWLTDPKMVPYGRSKRGRGQPVPPYDPDPDLLVKVWK